MQEVKDLFEGYICLAKNGIDDLDIAIDEYQKCVEKKYKLLLKAELMDIINNEKYEKTSHFLRKEVGVKFSFKKIELLLKYIYSKLCNLPTEMPLDELIKCLRK